MLPISSLLGSSTSNSRLWGTALLGLIPTAPPPDLGGLSGLDATVRALLILILILVILVLLDQIFEILYWS